MIGKLGSERKLDQKYQSKYVLSLNYLKRREKVSDKTLDQDEAHEEDYEFREISHFYGRDDLKGKYANFLIQLTKV